MAATTSGQLVASFLNTVLNQSTTTGVSSLENRNGETLLHAVVLTQLSSSSHREPAPTVGIMQAGLLYMKQQLQAGFT